MLQYANVGLVKRRGVTFCAERSFRVAIFKR